MPLFKTLVSVQLTMVCLVLLVHSVSADGDTIPDDRALGVIQATEQSIKKSTWVARATFGKLSESNNEGTRRTPYKETSFEAKVHFDPSSGKYRCDASSTEKWIDGTSPYIKHSSMRSFDGKVERNYDKGTPSNRPPKAGDLPGELVIEPEKAEGLISKWGWHTGIGSCPPYFANVKVSELVKNTVRVHGKVLIREVSPEVWLIRVQDRAAPTMAYNLTYDLGKGGLVTAATWEAYDPALDKRVFGRYTTELGQTSDGHYYPKMMQFDQPVDKLYRRVDLSEFEYGEPYDDSVYELDCPPGTRVVDKINRKFYIIGGGSSSDRDQTKEFMRREGLIGTEAEWEKQSSSGRWRKIAAGSAVAVLSVVFGVVFFFFKRRKFRSGAASSALIAILTVAGAGPIAKGAQEPVGFSENENGRESYVSQCGFNAIVFALEYCGRPKYDIDAICRCLDVNDEGIPFRQVRDVLQAHGLYASVREGVDLADLPEHLGRQQLAILPIRFGQTINHYIVLIKHPSKGLLAVDPPRFVVRLDENPSFQDRLSEMRKPIRSAALFVRADAKAVRAAGTPRPNVTPAVLDIGPVTIKTTPSNKTLACQVKNTGDRAMMVTGVHVPCGCMTADWAAAVIPAGGAKTLTLTVELAKWNPPNANVPSKDVYLDVLGQTPLKLTVAADLKNPAKEFRHRLDKNIHRFRLVEATPASLQAVSILSANEPIQPRDYIVASAPAWVQVGITAAAPDAIRLAVTLDPAKLPPLDTADLLDEEVRIEDGKHQLAHTIRLTVDRAFALVMPTPLVTIHAAKSKVHEITFSVPAGYNIDLSRIEVSGDSSLSARILARESGTRRVRCSIESPAVSSRPEYHTVNFLYKTDCGSVRARLTVHVVP